MAEPAPPSDRLARLSATALGRHQAGALPEAELLYRQVLSLEPNRAQDLHNLGVLQRQLGRHALAAELLGKAARLDGRNPSLHAQLAGALKAQGRLDEAQAAWRRVIALTPDSAEAHYNLANTLRDQGGRDEEAIAAYQGAIALKPDLAEAHINLGNMLKDRGELDEAAACYRRVLVLRPDYAEVHYNLGNVLAAQDALDEAAAAHRRATALKPDYALAHHGLGVVLGRKGELAAAAAAHGRAIAIRPDLAEAHYFLGCVQKDQGELEAAARSFRRAIDLKPDHAGALYQLAGLRPMNDGAPETEALFALLSRRMDDLDGVEPKRRAQLLFAIGKALEDRGEFDRAFACLEEANALCRAGVTFDIAEAERLMERVAEVFDGALLERLGGGGLASERPIFIVGMPRSGSTLVEQILAAHPAVHAAGEVMNLPNAAAILGDPAVMTAADCRAVGQAYVESLPADGPGARRVTDKLLSNFQRLGLIHRCLPGATIIHCRRDPRDVALSCFGIHFRDGLDYAYDLTEFARYWRAYDRLMIHWRDVLPPGRILEVPYEGVIDDVETWARRMVDHCGLEWDDACPRFFEARRDVRTASAAQVRRPIHDRSVGRWRPFAAHLGPLLDALGEPWTSGVGGG
jgi:tetratricopeptide (TPR) repeat protein